MGCDGGTIPKRDELVRKKKKPEQKDKTSELSFRWQHCAITQEPLRQPIVSCGLGRLYNKDSVIEAILDRSTAPDTAQHIKNLKDVKDLNLTTNPAYKPCAEKGDGYVDHQTSPYICPVIGLEMNGKFKFIFIWRCGCVMSERALKEVKTDVCHKCQKQFLAEDVVILNAVGEDLQKMETNLEIRQEKMRMEKKAKKADRQKVSEEDKVVSNSSEVARDIASQSVAGPSMLKPISKLNGKLSNRSDASGKRPLESELVDPQFKKAKSSYSVAKDPKATAVFKSLFTSHRAAVEQTKAHWVTYNPFYN